MKKNMDIIKISIFMGILLLPSLLWLGIRVFSPRLYQELNYDLGEKTAVEFPREFHMTDYTDSWRHITMTTPLSAAL